jgi:hypothetical protein
VNILGVTYRVKEVKVVNKQDWRKGQIDFVKCRIRIDSSMSRKMKEQTLMHEVLHGILEGLGMEELNSDERAVQSIASALHLALTSQTIFSS